MASFHRPWSLLLFTIVFFIAFLVDYSICQSNSQNIETFYPSSTPSSPPSPVVSPPPPPPPPIHQPPPPPPNKSPSSRKAVGTAIGVTAASTFVVAALAFFIFLKLRKRRKDRITAKSNYVNPYSSGRRVQPSLTTASAMRNSFARFEKNLKGLIVDENGLDVVYWRKLEGSRYKNSYRKEVLNRATKDEVQKVEEEKRIIYKSQSRKKQVEAVVQETPLLRGKSSTSQNPISPGDKDFLPIVNPIVRNQSQSSSGITLPIVNPIFRNQSSSSSSGITNLQAIEKQPSVEETPVRPPVAAIPVRQSPPPPQSPPRRHFTAGAARENAVTPPPPPPIASSSPAPPPALRPIASSSPAPPPPLRPIASSSPAPPPPPPKVVSSPAPLPPPPPKASSSVPPPPPPFKSGSVSRPPSAPKGAPKTEANKAGKSSTGDAEGQVKLKPLHWDKVNADVGHSMVWDKLDGGSFRFDGDLMEALFGTVATNRKSPKKERNANTNAVPSQIFILDSRRSQNIAIVLRSLPISRRELIDGLDEGQGLDADTLEKISRITLTKEEESDVLAFHGDPTRLAHAESFLYHLLRAIPSAFPRANAMLFKSTYDTEISQLKESLQVLELGCQELKTRGLFLKLLEAILKAGNRMNAGTARGNAQAFNLTSLRKLSDVKSTDGKTTLLHFVVEEVVRTEGKRCVLNRNRSLSRGNSKNSSHSGSPNAKEDKDSEYKRLGLPIVGGLSAEFSNVKKAATIDYDSLAKACSGLASRSAEIRKIVNQCAAEDEGRRDTGFVKQMRVFLEAAEAELGSIREEQTRVMELVKKTTEYYQASASKDIESNPLQLFVIVKDFLGMVDQVCVEISRNLQKRRNLGEAGSGSSNSPARRSPVNFPNLPEHFMSDRSGSTSSDSSDGF